MYCNINFLLNKNIEEVRADGFTQKTFSFDSSRLFVHMSPERKEIFGFLLMFIFFFLGENKKNC